MVVTSYDEDQSRGGVGRSSSSASSSPARRHHHTQRPRHHQYQHHNLHNSSTPTPSGGYGESKGYQYVPYKSSLSVSNQPTAHDRYSSQTSLPSHPSSRVANPRSQYVGFTSQGIAVQKLTRGQHNVPCSHPQHTMQYDVDTSQRNRSGHSPSARSQHQHGQGYNIAERQARSSSLKSGAHHVVDRYAEFSDTRCQFNNHVTPASYQKRGSSSSSENSPQGSPLHSQQLLLKTVHHHSPTNYSSYPPRGKQQAAPDSIHADLNELQHRKTKHSSSSRHNSEAFDSPYRTSSRNTFVKVNSQAPRRINSNESFSFASSIKCCVGFQPKRKKKSSQRVVAYHQTQQKSGEKEILTSPSSDNWVSLAVVRSQHSPHGYLNSPSQSTVSCPYTISPTKFNNSHKHSSGYASEMETSCSTLVEERYNSYYESDSDLSDSDFARAAAGSRGKSANSVMMKLAKKFSKKSFPITRDDSDGGSIGGDSLERGEENGKTSTLTMKQRSNSVSNLDSLEG